MAALVKVGMTKEEVIQAIGKPDMNSLEDPELSKKSKPGVFLFAYHDGLKSLMVSFQEEKVVRVNNLAPPPELEKQIRDTGVNP